MQRAPGHVLLALARRVIARTEVDRLVEPAIADLQHEWSASTGAPLLQRLGVRARAYAGALRVIGPRVIVGSVLASAEPPPWPVVRRIVGPSLVFITIMVVAASFGPAAARTREHWLFYLPDRILWHLPYVATCWFLWRGRPFEPGVPWLRAADVAKLATITFACCFALSGWIAPLLRQQYLSSLNLADFAVASVHQWTLPDLIRQLDGTARAPAALVASELHIRLLSPVLALVLGTVGWTAVRASRVSNDAIGMFVFVTGPLLFSALLRVGSFTTPRLSLERIAAEWAALAALAVLAFVAIRVFARVERSRRGKLEAQVVSLLHAIAVTRTPSDKSGAHA